ncbi:MAG: hypothetical protein V1857_02590 [archaeon]
MSVRIPRRTGFPLLLFVGIAVTSLLLGIPINSVGGQQEGSFLVSVSPSRVTVGSDGIGMFSIRVISLNGFSGTIGLAVTDLSAGIVRTSFSFQPSVLDLAADSEAYSALTVMGVYEGYQYQYSTGLFTINFKISATSGGRTTSTPASADILYGTNANIDIPDVIVNIQPNTLSISGDISQDKSQTIAITLSPKTTATSNTLLFTTTPQFYDPPAGLYVSFNPISVDLRAGQVLQITATVLMTPQFLEKSGTYRFAVGISGLLRGVLSSTTSQDVFITRTTIFTLVVSPFFNVAVNPSIINVYIGGQDQKLQVVITPLSRGLNQPITLTVEGVPPGILASFESNTLVPRGRESLSTNMLLNAPSTSKPGVFSIRILATAPGITRVAEASLNLRPSGDYSIKIDQPLVSLNARGESRSITLTVTPEGDFRATIDFSVTNLPRGVTATLSTTSATIQQAGAVTTILTLTAGQDTQPGTYDLAIIANTGFSTKTVNITLVVRSGSVEIWPVVLVVFVLIAVVSLLAFVGLPRRRQSRVVREIRGDLRSLPPARERPVVQSARAAEGTRYCISCGESIRADAKSCMRCGAAQD